MMCVSLRLLVFYLLGCLSQNKKSVFLCGKTQQPATLFLCVCLSAWCLRSEGVSSVLLGVSNTDQLLENLGSLRVRTGSHSEHWLIGTQFSAWYSCHLLAPDDCCKLLTSCLCLRFWLSWLHLLWQRWTRCSAISREAAKRRQRAEEERKTRLEQRWLTGKKGVFSSKQIFILILIPRVGAKALCG